jgi:DnaJ like chaperone protein
MLRVHNTVMSVWSRIAELAHAAFDPPTEPEPSESMACAPNEGDVDFTAAVVGLAAKMASADGSVSHIEERTFARVFPPPRGEEASFARVFSLARQTTHGFESYARRIGKRYRNRPCLLEDVLDGLFAVALADGAASTPELNLLKVASDAFGFDEVTWRRIRATWLGPDPGDPYAVLGLTFGTPFEEVRKAWRRLAAEHHPDTMAARGAPAPFIKLAHDKTAALNAAYAEIARKQQALPASA